MVTIFIQINETAYERSNRSIIRKWNFCLPVSSNEGVILKLSRNAQKSAVSSKTLSKHVTRRCSIVTVTASNRRWIQHAFDLRIGAISRHMQRPSNDDHSTKRSFRSDYRTCSRTWQFVLRAISRNIFQNRASTYSAERIRRNKSTNRVGKIARKLMIFKFEEDRFNPVGEIGSWV